jgi:hypothetical protein
MPTILVKHLAASAFNTFLAFSYLEKSDTAEMEATCIEQFEDLNLKDTYFFAYYKAKEGFKFRKGQIKLIIGISNVTNTKGVEYFNKLLNTPRTNPSTSTDSISASTSKRAEIEIEEKKLNYLLTIPLH